MTSVAYGIAFPASRGILARSNSWLLAADGVTASTFMDFTTEGGANHYYAGGQQYGSFAALWASLSGTFTRASTADRVNASGLLESVGTDVLRFDHDAGGGPTGILVEGGSNFTLYPSNGFTTAFPHSNYATLAAAGETAPDGTADTFAFTDSAVSGPHRIFGNSVVSAADTPYTIALYAKMGTLRYLALSLYSLGHTNAFAAAVFDLQDGVVGQTGGGSSTGTVIGTNIAPAGNGWFRLAMTGQGNQTDFAFLVNGAPALTGNALLGASGLISYVGSGQTAYLYGASVEQASLASSYAPTTTAPVARAADGLTRSRSALSAHSGLIRAATAPGVGSSPQTLWQVDDGTASNRARVYRDSSRHIRVNVTAGGVDQCDLDCGAVADGTEFALAFRLGDNDFAASLNGAAPVADTAGSIPAGLTSDRLGIDEAGYGWFGHVKQRGAWDGHLLSDSGLQALAT